MRVFVYLWATLFAIPLGFYGQTLFWPNVCVWPLVIRYPVKPIHPFSGYRELLQIAISPWSLENVQNCFDLYIPARQQSQILTLVVGALAT